MTLGTISHFGVGTTCESGVTATALQDASANPRHFPAFLVVLICENLRIENACSTATRNGQADENWRKRRAAKNAPIFPSKGRSLVSLDFQICQ
jgi:hypothetical protein